MNSSAAAFVSETFPVHDRDVACDGGGGALGHPRVYLYIGQAGEIACPYCSRRFVLVGDGAEHH